MATEARACLPAISSMGRRTRSAAVVPATPATVRDLDLRQIFGKPGSSLEMVIGKSRTRTPVAL